MTVHDMRHQESIDVAAPPAAVYALVSDMPRMGEFSPETVGGRWADGATGSVGDSYFGEIVFHPYQNDHTPTDDRTLVDARISLNDIGAGDGRFRVSVWGKNLTDEEYRLFGIDFGTLGFSNAVFGTPRTYGLDVVYNFD